MLARRAMETNVRRTRRNGNELIAVSLTKPRRVVAILPSLVSVIFWPTMTTFYYN